MKSPLSLKPLILQAGGQGDPPDGEYCVAIEERHVGLELSAGVTLVFAPGADDPTADDLTSGDIVALWHQRCGPVPARIAGHVQFHRGHPMVTIRTGPRVWTAFFYRSLRRIDRLARIIEPTVNLRNRG